MFKTKMSLEEKYAKHGELVEAAPRMKVEEALSTTDASIVLPKILSAEIREAADPLLIVTNFLTPISLDSGRSVEFPVAGMLHCQEIPEGGEYPEQTMPFAQNQTVEVRVRKYGLKIKITDEMVQDSQWDIIGMHLREAGRAMARFKEREVFKTFVQMGKVVFDNTDPMARQTTGTDENGAANQTFDLEDLIDMIAELVAAEMTPSDVIMHPLAWTIIAKDPIMGKLGTIGLVAPDVNSDPKTMKAPFQLSLVLSPYVPFDPVSRTTTLFVIDRSNVGVMLIKTPIQIDQFNDPHRDIRVLKVMERYGIGVLNGGLAISVAKGIRLARNYGKPLHTRAV